MWGEKTTEQNAGKGGKGDPGVVQPSAFDLKRHLEHRRGTQASSDAREVKERQGEGLSGS